MRLNSALIPLFALGLAVAFTAPPTAYSAQPKKPAASLKLKAHGGGRSRAQPGDTCLGVSACNTLIVECILSGHEFKPMQHKGPNGEPSYGQCVKRTD
jgi:hypothetical protein